jgi:hypothetical protein
MLICVLILLVIFCFVVMVRRGRFQWMTGPIGSWFLIGIGLLLLCVLPVLGLLAAGGGITAKLRRLAAG